MSSVTNEQLIATFERAHLDNYRPAPFVLTQGKGCRVQDVEGRSFLDLCAGIAVLCVGHAHPKLVTAISQQASRLMHTSNLYYNDRSIELAERLARRTPFTRFFFCNSGAEAIEGLLKLARRYHYGRGDTGRRRIVSALGSFHGRSMGALSVTGQRKYHEGFEPLVGEIEHVPYGDVEALSERVDQRTAAVLLEPIQGEGGLVVGSDAYLRAARQLCTEAGALLFFDEIQTGYGRTGRFLAREWSGVMPDACALAKGIAGGFPMGAMALAEHLLGSLPPGTHATTFGGNPLACAAALAVLDIFDDEDLVGNAQRMGNHLSELLDGLVRDQALPHAIEARGRGLLRGVVLAEDVDPRATLRRVNQEGVLLSVAGGGVLRFSPPLCVTRAELEEGVAAVRSVLAHPPTKTASQGAA